MAQEQIDVATVNLWGERVGAVSWDHTSHLATFEYYPEYIKSGFPLSPITVPLQEGARYTFRALSQETYSGLPGLLADSLPDKYGNALIDQWLAANGRAREDFSSVERLCYMGTRGMGALEFSPAIRREVGRSVSIEMSSLVELAQRALSDKENLQTNFQNDTKSLNTIIQVGTSAGGARAKAVIGWNPTTSDVRSGQVDLPAGYEHWLLKFDGVSQDILGDPQGFGRIEYVYYQMATMAGINMSPCRLLEENGRAHFMTKRFDRDHEEGKYHMQSLCALAHYDYNMAGAYSYEQAMQVILTLRLGVKTLTEFFRRLVFNIVARNQDDHTKNISFLMNKKGEWSLSPAFDVTWCHNPEGTWTNRHQMTLREKRDQFVKDDLLAIAHQYDIRNASEYIEQVIDAVLHWESLAKDIGIENQIIEEIKKSHRLTW
jgi:serine/threonine-protein kinase HipA